MAKRRLPYLVVITLRVMRPYLKQAPIYKATTLKNLTLKSASLTS
jgi:hypothetical protein